MPTSLITLQFRPLVRPFSLSSHYPPLRISKVSVHPRLLPSRFDYIDAFKMEPGMIRYILENTLYPNIAPIALIAVVVWVFFSWFLHNRRGRLGPPIMGYKSTFEPIFLLQTRFIWGAQEIIHSAYQQVRNASIF
jgi:hypothetical protein